MEHVNCFSVGECHYIVFIINKHYYAEISKVLAGYRITSIVQNVYWLLSKILFYLCMDPEYHNQVDKFIKNSKKNSYNLHIQQSAILLAKKMFKTRLVLLVAFREHKCLVPYITTSALSLHFFVTLGSEGFFILAEKELGL